MSTFRTILALLLTLPLYLPSGFLRHPFADEWERLAKGLFTR